MHCKRRRQRIVYIYSIHKVGNLISPDEHMTFVKHKIHRSYVYYIYKQYAAAGACSARNLSRHFWAAYGEGLKKKSNKYDIFRLVLFTQSLEQASFTTYDASSISHWTRDTNIVSFLRVFRLSAVGNIDKSGFRLQKYFSIRLHGNCPTTVSLKNHRRRTQF